MHDALCVLYIGIMCYMYYVLFNVGTIGLISLILSIIPGLKSVVLILGKG